MFLFAPQAPKTSVGWFRAGVGFYNKRRFEFAVECLQQAVQLDPLNYNAFQIMARACIALNRAYALWLADLRRMGACVMSSQYAWVFTWSWVGAQVVRMLWPH